MQRHTGSLFAAGGRFVPPFFPALVSFVLLMGCWEGLVQVFAIPVYLLPGPSAIVGTFFQQPGYLLGIGLFTFGEAVAGFVLGCALGVVVAGLCVRFGWLADALVPLSVLTNAVPIVALSPLLGVWLGSTTSASKIGVVTLMAFFPTLIGVYRGFSAPSADALQLMRSYAASPFEVFLKLRVPAALPYFFSALKVCSTLSMIGAVVAEFFGGQQNSLGVYIKSQAGVLRMREAWSAILVACLIGVVFYVVIAVVERLSMPWHVSFRRRSS